MLLIEQYIIHTSTSCVQVFFFFVCIVYGAWPRDGRTFFSGKTLGVEKIMLFALRRVGAWLGQVGAAGRPAGGEADLSERQGEQVSSKNNLFCASIGTRSRC